MEELFSTVAAAGGGTFSVGGLMLWFVKSKFSKLEKDISSIRKEMVIRDLELQKLLASQEKTNALQEKDLDYLKDSINKLK